MNDLDVVESALETLCHPNYWGKHLLHSARTGRTCLLGALGAQERSHRNGDYDVSGVSDELIVRISGVIMDVSGSRMARHLGEDFVRQWSTKQRRVDCVVVITEFNDVIASFRDVRNVLISVREELAEHRRLALVGARS